MTKCGPKVAMIFSKYRFSKYQALGNDFVILDEANHEACPPTELVRFLCDRHCGVGADGVLWVKRPANEMVVFNADGSLAGMCGNGLRCVAAYLLDGDELATGKVDISAVGNRYTCARKPNGEIQVAFGTPSWRSNELPERSFGGAEITLNLEPNIDLAVPEQHNRDQRGNDNPSITGTCVWFGNPHFVNFLTDDTTSPLALATHYGAAIERHPDFQNRVNASFAKRSSDGFEVVVHERGVGITQACGSGACAVVVAAIRRGHWQRHKPCRVLLPGGALTIAVDDTFHIQMTGHAEKVFEGRMS